MGRGPVFSRHRTGLLGFRHPPVQLSLSRQVRCRERPGGRLAGASDQQPAQLALRPALPVFAQLEEL